MRYYVYKDNQQIGPFEEFIVEAKLKDNSFLPTDVACREGENNWQPLSTFFPLHSATPYSWQQDSGNLNPPQEQRETYQQQRSTSPNFPPQQQFNQQLQSPPPVQHVVHHHTIGEQPEGTLPTLALTGGIICASLMLLGLIPCLGWLNWFVIIGGGITKILCWVTIFTVNNPKARNKAVIGLIMVMVALFIGTFRLALGGGCL